MKRVIIALLLCACDAPAVEECSVTMSIKSVETVKDLPLCHKCQDSYYFVESTKHIYYCDGKAWWYND